MKQKGITKRDFLQAVGVGVPTMLAMNPAAAAQAADGTRASAATPKATPLDCSRYFTASSRQFGPRQQAARLHDESREDRFLRLPGGERTFRGIPFLLGPENVDRRSWIVLSREESTWATPRVEIPVDQVTSFVCLAAVCDWDTEVGDGDDPAVTTGLHLADLVLVFEDGTEHAHPVRRRFEVAPPQVGWGELCYTAVSHRESAPRGLSDPLPNAMMWGDLQSAIWDPDYQTGPGDEYGGWLWISAYASPHPDRNLRAVRLAARTNDPLIVCGLTLFQGSDHPLRYERRRTYRFTLPDGAGNEPAKDWDVDVDLGVVAKLYRLPEFDRDSWLASPAVGLGERDQFADGDRFLYADVAAGPDAVLTLRNVRSGGTFVFDLADAGPDTEVSPRSTEPRIEVIERHKTWLSGRITDADTGRPTPVRIAFRGSNGRYIPPYGHRAEINSAWFQDYGADVKRDSTSFAYIDGSFQIELPVGEVFVEITKGFEYEPIRRKLRIEPNQRDLSFEVSRLANLRAEKWASADTHVHFLSPPTAILEAQAEDLNLVHLLAAQWGDLFTSVGDLTHGSLVSPDGETAVHVGTENRQHILGHLGLLGGRGEPVFPMAGGPPDEGQIGMPLWSSLADWADRCRQNEGIAVAAHFPRPIAELAADIALGKIDAVELWPRQLTEKFDALPFRDWYRYLNCGYRLPAVSGTDKMGAWIPVGMHRAYAYLGEQEFSVRNWSAAVRRGNTFMSSGPLLDFQADGHLPGDEIEFRAGGGRVEVQARARCGIPMHRLEIVRNGQVAASHVEEQGTKELRLVETIEVAGPAWLAARCFSRFQSAGSRVAAHTSPVYVTVPGQDLFSAPVATYMLKLIDGAESWASELATRPDPATLERVLRVFRDARSSVVERLRRHAGPA